MSNKNQDSGTVPDGISSDELTDTDMLGIVGGIFAGIHFELRNAGGTGKNLADVLLPDMLP